MELYINKNRGSKEIIGYVGITSEVGEGANKLAAIRITRYIFRNRESLLYKEGYL